MINVGITILQQMNGTICRHLEGIMRKCSNQTMYGSEVSILTINITNTSTQNRMIILPAGGKSNELYGKNRNVT
jgi:hypothetical protein